MWKRTIQTLILSLEIISLGCSSSSTQPVVPSEASQEAAIEQSINRLPEDDRTAAKRQRFCAVMEKERLGQRDTPIKVVIGERSVFVCCDGCVSDAKQNPKKTLDTLAKVLSGHR
ncbi:MAG: hypothetical protein NT013_31025 [Planctomycetia bacterium]|nr:hypothetical protein [Planctomycetia bacterium]